VHEWWRLSLALCGDMRSPHWAEPGRAADLTDLKGIVELLAARLGHAIPTYRPERSDPLYHPGRAATVECRAGDGSTAIAGRAGELHPSVLASWEVRSERLLVAELAIASLSAGSPGRVVSRLTGHVPTTERDLAIVVDESRSAGEVLSVIRETSGGAIERVTLFDIYRGAPLAANEKSLAFRLTFGSGEAGAVDATVAAVRAAVETELGAHIRG
jgi:phenylalanyl-tRNA synthetase beta chain